MKPSKPRITAPQMFQYDERRLRRSRVAAIAAAVTVFSILPSRVLLNAPVVCNQLGPWMFAGMLITVIAVGASMAAAVYFSSVPRINDGIRRRGQRIIVDDAEITFDDGDRIVRAAWANVTEVRRALLGNWAYAVRRIVVTSDGEFDYTLALRHAPRLDRIVRQTAVNARYTTADPEDTIGVQTQAPGVHIYHYRTYTNRALLMFPLGFVLIAAVVGVLQAQGFAEHPSPATPWVIGLGSFAVWASGLWRYRSVSIRTDAHGITWTGPSRRIVVPWNDIKSFRMRGSDVCRYGEVVGSRATIRFWIGISECDALKHEIESLCHKRWNT